MTVLYLDADGCRVNDEVYRVAARYKLDVFVVSSNWLRTPQELRIIPVVVEGGPSAADRWIADRAKGDDVVITADIPLAERVLRRGVRAVHPDGRLFAVDNGGGAQAPRGFLQALEETVVKAQRASK